MIWSVSWRNVWRNKLRSGVVLTAIALGVFAGLFSMAFMKGMANQRLESATMTEVSHIQIHTPEFVDVNDIENFFKGSSQMLEEINDIQGVKSSSERIIVNSIINSAEKGTGIKLVGVHPEKEKTVTNLHEKLIAGNYLNPMKRGKPIIIGKKLAETLGVENGSKVVIATLNIEGQPMYHQFKVAGIFQTVSTPFDKGTAFVDFEDLQEITGVPGGSAHEIAILLEGRYLSADIQSRLQEMYPDLDVKQWSEIMPELSYLTETMDYFMYIFILIILLALGFGIVNTMLMVVLERVKELGMLMAVGMNKLRVFAMILLETVFLCLTGGIVGIALGSSLSFYFSNEGLDLSALYGEGLSAIGYDSVIFTVLTPDMIGIVVFLVILTGVLASVYPAIKALKLSPAEAIRTDA